MEIFGEWGYIGLFIGTFLAATVIPFSSEFLIVGILIAGYSPLISCIVATLGNWLGGLTSYWLGYAGKWEWLEHWFGISKERLEGQQRAIERWGAFIALFCWAPIVGDLFAVALGFYRLNFLRCSIYMFIGKAIRFAVWSILYAYYGEAFLNLFN